ncbi:MAG: alpha/beta hydrolase [Eubacteriales bacterium]|nr:alpha/beta hydrolase [Eubacteriales bacterium]
MKRTGLLFLISFALIVTSCGFRTEDSPSGSSGIPSESSQSVETPESSVSSESFAIRELCVVREGLSIYGELYLPVLPEEKLPAVILSHSANLTGDSLKSYCERIAERGMIAYAFDFCGGSKNSRSDGREEEMTVFTEMEDLLAVLNAIKELNVVDSQNIFLFGTSQGGLVSALAAAQCPSAVKGLILFYPGFNIAELAQKYGTFLSGSAGSPFLDSLLDYDVYEHIKDFEGDVLILHGTKDFIVPYSYSEKAAALYPNCELHLIEGASHGFNTENYAFSDDYDKESWGYVEAFLAKQLQQESSD